MEDDKFKKVFDAVLEGVLSVMRKEAEGLTDDDKHLVMSFIAFKLIWYLAGQV